MGRVASRNENVDTETKPKIQTLDDLNKVKDNNNRKKFPDPKPPKRCKKDILPDVSKLKHIDDHVMKVCLSWVNNITEWLYSIITLTLFLSFKVAELRGSP